MYELFLNCEVNKNGKWIQNTKPVFINPQYNEHEVYKRPEERKLEKEIKLIDQPDLMTVNYDINALFGNVTNAYKGLGYSVSDPWEYMSSNRGIPTNCNEDWKEEMNRFSESFFAHTYITLEDFNKLDLNQVNIKRGLVKLEEYYNIRETAEQPEFWYLNVEAKGSIVIDSTIADLYIEKGNSDFVIYNKATKKEQVVNLHNYDVYVIYEWVVIYRSYFRDFIEKVIEPMKVLNKKYESVRLLGGYFCG